MVIKAPAKINLCLHIKGRRADGYHELETIMQAIDIYDELSINLADEFTFTCSDPALREDNLVIKAAHIFFHIMHKQPRVNIYLHKRIPHGAGLGGGSSDAAAALLGLNRLYDNVFNYQQLWAMACKLGADVPFFLTRGTAMCRGIGELVEPLPGFPLCNYLLVKPPVNISTAAVYKNLHIKNLQFENRLSRISPLLFKECDISSIMRNDLERPALAFYPELLNIKKEINGHGAEGVLMSGSGSTVVGLFTDQIQSERAARMLAAEKPDDWWIVACKGTIADF